MDIRRALHGFFTAYSHNDPTDVYQYMTVDRGETMNDTTFEELQNVIKEYNNSVVTNPENAFSSLWQLHHCGANWESILDGSGTICFWKTNEPLTKAQFLILNSLDESLFNNRTTFHHLFSSNVSYFELLEKKMMVQFAEVFFVVELTSDFDNGFLPIGIRFWYNKEAAKWLPKKMVVVRADSFDVPLLLF